MSGWTAPPRGRERERNRHHYPRRRPLLSGQPASIHEITTVTGIDTAALADTLIAQGICAELTPDPDFLK